MKIVTVTPENIKELTRTVDGVLINNSIKWGKNSVTVGDYIVTTDKGLVSLTKHQKEMLFPSDNPVAGDTLDLIEELQKRFKASTINIIDEHGAVGTYYKGDYLTCVGLNALSSKNILE